MSMVTKYYIVSYYVKAVNSADSVIVDKIVRKVLRAEKGQTDEDVLTESTYNSLARAIMLDITQSVTNPNLTPELQKTLSPNWDKSEVILIGIAPCYEKAEEPQNAESTDNI